MESHIDDDLHSYNSMEAVDDLLEECWFFGNLLNITPRSSNKSFTRCYSDPCPCSSSTTTNTSNQTMSVSPLPLEKDGNLSRALTMSGGPKEEKREKKSSASDGDGGRSKLLTRTKTMPSSMRNNCMNIEQTHRGDNDHHRGKMTKSDRRDSLNLAEFLPPRHDKGNQRHNSKPPRSIDMEGKFGSTSNGSKEMMRRYLKGKSLRRSTSDLEIEEVQGFKDLGFTFDNKDSLCPSVVNILPGLQEKTTEDLELENNNHKVKRPYLSEAWLIQSCVTPPTPIWASSSSSSEDRKAQIKYWARSVASNVRMEC